MLLPEKREREYRFRLALRIGLPIFALVITFISHTLITTYSSLQASFYFEAILLLAFSVYFILFLLYNGFNVKIMDDVSKAFTREYVYKHLEKELKASKDYTLILISIENLHDVNRIYGMNNGDYVLNEVVEWSVAYLKNANIDNVPIGRLHGGYFLIGLKGSKEKYSTIVELFCLKSTKFRVNDIEVKISASMTDANYSHELNFMMEHLFELLEVNKKSKPARRHESSMDPNEVESIVINAIKKREIVITSQSVLDGEKSVFQECFVKIKSTNSKYLYPKRYMKVVNKLGLSVAFDLLVLETVLSKKRANQNMTYAINVSPSSLRNDNFLIYAKEVLREYQRGDNKIVFILSEQEYYSYTSRYNSILNSLRRLGVLIAIDRVGSLHSSFLYLRELDIDIVRIDSYYSSEIKMRENYSIIDGFNLMAQEKGVKTWIKNIEDTESLALAREFKIDYIQGKHIASLEKIDDTNEDKEK